MRVWVGLCVVLCMGIDGARSLRPFVVASANLNHPTLSQSRPQWCQQQDVAPLFSWLELPPLSAEEHRAVLTQGFPGLAPRVRERRELFCINCIFGCGGGGNSKPPPLSYRN